MKKNVIQVLLFALISMALLSHPAGAYAQDNAAAADKAADVPATKDTDFYFVYIDHEPGMPRKALIDKLDEIHKFALDYNNALVVYLANEDEPFVSFTNVKDPEGQRDSEEAYETVCQELQSAPFHGFSELDGEMITNIIGANGVRPLFNSNDEEDPILFRSVKIMFFVGQRFWRLGYNEKVIAEVYVRLNLDRFMKRYPSTVLGYEIWRDKDNPLPGETGPVPFGTHNRSDINNNKKIKFYSFEN